MHKFTKTFVTSAFCCIGWLHLAAEQVNLLPAHLTNGWYPQQQQNLQSTLHQAQRQAAQKYGGELDNIRAVIVPHAGYRYSGTIAASCYRLLRNKKYDRIILLAPSHTLGFAGIAVPTNAQGQQLATGTLPFDTAVLQKLAQSKPCIAATKLPRDPFAAEHSFEIQCPFLYDIFQDSTPVVPLIVGNLTPEQIRQAAALLAQSITTNTLVIISSDFTHYGTNYNFTPAGPTAYAQNFIHRLDKLIIDSLLYPSLSKFLQVMDTTQATVCGHYPLAILEQLLETKCFGSVQPHLTAYTTSQEIEPSQQDSSVSYTGIVYADDCTLTKFEEKILLDFAKNTVAAKLQSQDAQESTQGHTQTVQPQFITPCMQQKCGTFVTWYGPNHTLRGCIGTVGSDQPLLVNIAQYSQQAALHDTRFAPITSTELATLTPSITVLSPFTKVASYQDIQIGLHGILLKHGNQQAVFLPQVPVEFGWNLATTLDQLALKAGLARTAWKDKQAEFYVCTGYEIR